MFVAANFVFKASQNENIFEHKKLLFIAAFLIIKIFHNFFTFNERFRSTINALDLRNYFPTHSVDRRMKTDRV